MTKANADLREKISSSGIKQWELADRLNISEGTLTRRLRHEVNEAQRNEILTALDDIRSGK